MLKLLDCLTKYSLANWINNMHNLIHVNLNNIYFTKITNNSHTSCYAKIFLQWK